MHCIYCWDDEAHRVTAVHNQTHIAVHNQTHACGSSAHLAGAWLLVVAVHQEQAPGTSMCMGLTSATTITVQASAHALDKHAFARAWQALAHALAAQVQMLESVCGEVLYSRSPSQASARALGSAV
jgi:hypothetical protein